MREIEQYIAPEVIPGMRSAIAGAGDNEVFFAGYLDEARRVVQVKPVARGHRSAVPAVLEVAREADVVIHNHPSGQLTPSDADLAIAGHLNGFSVAFYIVNNPVSRIYVVVEPFSRREITELDFEQAASPLRPGGPISAVLSGYEERPQQIEMIDVVCLAFNQDKVAAIEAGTGTGKTLAYLLPAIQWSLQNRERVVVSTNTINLQEQLIKKDIPLLKKCLDLEFDAVLVKGRSNYACLRKVNEIDAEFDLMAAEEDREELRQLISWARRSKDGSKSDLSQIPRPEIWEQLASESDTCTRGKCPFFRNCFVNRARRLASRANILVVNHHLLFADLALRHEISGLNEAAVLPPYQRIVFDEAHHLEEVATHYFGSRITRTGLLRLFGRLYRRQKNNIKGLLPAAAAKTARSGAGEIQRRLQSVVHDRLIPEITALEQSTHEVMDRLSERLRELSGENGEGERKLRMLPAATDTLWAEGEWRDLFEGYLQRLKELGQALSTVSGLLTDIEARTRLDLSSIEIEISAISGRLTAAADILRDVLFGDDEENIRWVELGAFPVRKNVLRFQSSPLVIDPLMNAAVYDVYPTVILTSATLTVEGSFDFLAGRIGLSHLTRDRRVEFIAPAPFDYEKQVMIAIPTDLPEPNRSGFADSVGQAIFRALAISKGRAFVLFTSYSLLNRIHTRLCGDLERIGIPVLRQGGVNRHELLKRFRQETSSVLFATDSFWEGVDVEGQALEAVLITRLPFRVPNEPIVAARFERIERLGGNAFMEYAVPLAVLKFKQGFGRLIRRKTDRGAVCIFDRRVAQKGYGKAFLRSLPPCNTITGTAEHVFSELERFFAR